MNTLTVGELIEQLQQYDQDMLVVSCSNYGDRNNTMQAIPTNELKEVYLSKATYSESGYKVVEDGDQEEDQLVVVLNYDCL
jgi:hypothetical protein